MGEGMAKVGVAVFVTALVAQMGWMIKLTSDISAVTSFIQAHLMYHQHIERKCDENRSETDEILHDHEVRIREMEKVR